MKGCISRNVKTAFKAFPRPLVPNLEFGIKVCQSFRGVPEVFLFLRGVRKHRKNKNWKKTTKFVKK